jgi:hypothetical protein
VFLGRGSALDHANTSAIDPDRRAAILDNGPGFDAVDRVLHPCCDDIGISRVCAQGAGQEEQQSCKECEGAGEVRLHEVGISD